MSSAVSHRKVYTVLLIEGIFVANASAEAYLSDETIRPDVLMQENEGKLYRVGLSSKKLSLAEAKYPNIKKECLAVVWGIWRFKLYLAGKRFTLQTDHKPLKYLKNAAYQNDGVFRWSMGVQEYSFHMEDMPGNQNIGAGFWSRNVRTGIC